MSKPPCPHGCGFACHNLALMKAHVNEVHGTVNDVLDPECADIRAADLVSDMIAAFGNIQEPGDFIAGGLDTEPRLS